MSSDEHIVPLDEFMQLVRAQGEALIVDFRTLIGGARRNSISGLITSNNGSDPDADIDISIGECIDSGNVDSLVLPSILVKQLNSPWVVGSNQGGLDTGISPPVEIDTWYHGWLIKRSDTGVVDVLFSKSVSTPTMPTNYDLKRRIGSVLTDGSSNIIGFQAIEEAGGAVKFEWDNPVADVNGVGNPGISAVTRTISVPTGIVVEAILVFKMWELAATANSGAVYSLAISDFTLTPTNSDIRYPTGAITGDTVKRVETNTNAQVRTKQSVSNSNSRTGLSTLGWIDRRNE